ncbi:peptidoglycan DD-metalloendopeptidase family protein [Maribacter sp. 2210JD10-5]|uniref:peptidoglycan DD-metalloendopeptidase family protein n=1 Tax=Maribacter sp. 2210JD10-5 TaxID=3386272 RepID=UPI0039BD8354
MAAFELLLKSISHTPIAILDERIPISSYVTIDLSSKNPELLQFDITNPNSCQAYIDQVLKLKEGQVAYGGYLEERNLYSDKENFAQTVFPRNIHLGIDFWCIAGTKVLAPVTGTVHSFKNNDTKGDYGPTIVLKHKIDDIDFFTLYGHLSLGSIKSLTIGKKIDKGTILGTLGTPDINVNYAPHLHFQIIKDLENNFGDYPGVCNIKDLDFYRGNCPNPDLLLKNIG